MRRRTVEPDRPIAVGAARRPTNGERSGRSRTGANDFQLLACQQPATPYSVIAYITPSRPAQSFYTYTLGWRDSVSGKLQNNAVIFTVDALKSEINRFLDTDDFDSAPQAFALGAWLPWLRIEDDGSERIAYVSADGVSRLEVWRASRTAFLTATRSTSAGTATVRATSRRRAGR